MECFFITSMALYKSAERTGKPPSDVNVWVDRATLQVGKGTVMDHAAHSNAAAGLSDNLKEIMRTQIVQEGLSPKKKIFLSRVRKLSGEHIEDLEKKHTDESLVQQILDFYWPTGSLLKGTELEVRLNSTVRLPRELNLGCDKQVEHKLRSPIADLTKQVMMGSLNPREATEKYVEKLNDHFNSQVAHYQEKLAIATSDKEIAKCKKQILYNEKESEGIDFVHYEALERDFLAPNSTPKIPIYDLEKKFTLFD